MKKLIVANQIQFLLKASKKIQQKVIANIYNLYYVVERKDWSNKARIGG
jgi:hypothetical protein